MDYKAEFERPDGTKFTKIIDDANNIEDATIEGTNFAEDEGLEMLGIDINY